VRARLAILVVLAAAGGRAAAEDAPMDAIRERLNIRGTLRTVGELEFLKYEDGAITRTGTDASANLLEYVSLQATGLGDPRISAFASGRYAADVIRPPAASELADLSDAEPARRHWKLFLAYVEARDLLAGHVTIRAGRQAIDGFAPVSLDGARVDVAGIGPLRATAYGGLRASVYSGTDDHPVVGGEVGARLPGGLDVVAGAFHYVTDEIGIEARESIAPDLSFSARLEAIGGSLSEATATGRGRLAAAGLEARLGYTRWFSTERFPYDYTFERADPEGITRLLVGSRTDGNEWSGEVVFDLLPHVVISARGRIFRPLSGERDPYNLAYREFSPGLEVYDLPWTGLGVDVRFTRYRADTGVPADLDPTTVEGFVDLRGEGVARYDEVEVELAQRFAQAFRVEVGGLFRREDYVDRFGEIHGAKSWDAWFEARWLASAAWTVSLRYDHARDFDLIAPDVAWDQRVRLEVRYAF
jgi:hypothetical protein